MAIEPDTRDGTTRAVLIEPATSAVVVDQVVTPPIADPGQSLPRHRVGAHRGESSQQQLWEEVHSAENPDRNLPIADWLYRSREASFFWLIVRLWLGYQWANAGYQKIWGSERAGFWFGGGAGVKGFATAGVLGSTAGKGGASYGWWAAFLHDFVIPNASTIGRVVSVGELLIGAGLILGLFTGAAALAGVLLNLTYMFSGSAGVNPMFALLGVFLVLAWRNAGWFGRDRFVLHRRAPDVVPSQ